MKKVLFISVSLVSFSIFAEEPKTTKDNSISVGLSASPVGVGASVDWNLTKEDDDSVSISSSTIELKPVSISSGEGASSGRRFHIDIVGDSEKRMFLTDKDDSVVPYFQRQFSGLEYTYDGQDSSWRMLNAGVGAGLKLNLSENVKLSAQAGLGIGVELGKRDGFFDTSLYTKAELDLYDMVRVVAKEEVRSSFGGDREIIGELSTSVRVNDNLRAGVEFERSQNRFSNPSNNYQTNYGGVFVSGRFGKSE